MIDTPLGPRTVFDAHTHFFDASFLRGLGRQVGLEGNAHDAVAARLGWDAPPADPADVGRRWVAEMDRHGVDRMVSMHVLPGDVDSAARGIAATNGRLVGYVMVNPLAPAPGGPGGPGGPRPGPAPGGPGGPAPVEQVKRAVLTLGFRGVALFPAMFQFSLRAEPVEEILSFANEHALNVFVHCGVLKVGFRTKLGLPSTFDATFASPLALQRPAAQYPRVKFIIPHLGSGLLRELLMLADQAPNVYSDTSGVAGWAKYLDGAPPPARVLRQAVDVMGAGRLLFGTDSTFFPRGWRRDVFDQQMVLFAEAGLNEEQVTRILGGNSSGMV
jgi:predicted TIM-barrel fold metal-dependent hydrolase